MKRYSKTVAVIGAGASGLLATKELLEEGHEVFTFEQLQESGGLWNYRPEIPKQDNGYILACYESLQLNSCNLTSCFSDFPNNPSKGLSFPTHSEFASYLHEYTQRFNLKRYIYFGCEVIDLKRKGEQWSIVYNDKDKIQQCKVVDRVVVAMRYGLPYIPKFQAMSTYQGECLHSSQWRGNDIFPGKEILVVGGSVSGADCVEKALKNGVKKIYWALSAKNSSALWAFNRYPYRNKIPLDHALSRFDALVPNRSQRFVNSHTFLIAREQHRRLPNLYTDKACILDSRVMKEGIESKRVQFIASIKKFRKNSVVLEESMSLKPDLIVFATGFHRYWPFLKSTISLAQMNRENWYQFMLPIEENKLKGIAFLIQTSSYGSTFPTMEIQSRWLARKWADTASFSEKDHLQFRAEVKAITKRLKTGQSYFHLPNPTKYRDRLASEIGCCPPILRYLLSINTKKRYLALCMLFGPILPQHYRVRGKGSSDAMVDYIINQTEIFLGKRCVKSIHLFWNLVAITAITILSIWSIGMAIK